MNLSEAMQERHSVRAYTDRPIEPEKVETLRALVAEINRDTGLHLQLQVEEPGGFDGIFGSVRNYFVLAGAKNRDREIGYYGEELVLAAQMLGLNTCWVALTFHKRKAVYDLQKGEKLYVVIALGYGENPGKPHPSKPLSAVSDCTDASPAWYRTGMEAVLLAPTAINQQKFSFSLQGDTVSSKPGTGFYTEMDLGIAQYHFDAATGGNYFGLRRKS